MDCFEIIKLIGSGGFSKVYLCRFKKDGTFYAMKVIEKDVIVHSDDAFAPVTYLKLKQLRTVDKKVLKSTIIN